MIKEFKRAEDVTSSYLASRTLSADLYGDRQRRHRRHRRKLTGRDCSATPAVRSANQGGTGGGKVKRARAIYSFIGLSWEDRVGRGCATTEGWWWRAGRWKRVRGGIRGVQGKRQQGSWEETRKGSAEKRRQRETEKERERETRREEVKLRMKRRNKGQRERETRRGDDCYK